MTRSGEVASLTPFARNDVKRHGADRVHDRAKTLYVIARSAATKQTHRNLLTICLLVFSLILSGCALIEPHATALPNTGAVEINPNAGIKLYISGLTTRVHALEVKVNGKAVPARLDGSTLVVDGSETLATDTEYEIWLRLSGWHGQTSLDRFVYSTVQTPQPVIPAGGLVAREEGGAAIKWNIPLKTLRYRLEPPARSKLEINNSRKTAYLFLPDYHQGQQYKLTFVDAVGLNGYHLKSSPGALTASLSTTTPLLAGVEPHYGAREVSRSTGIVFTFNDAVVNQSVVKGLFSVTPPVPGTLAWPAPNKLTFTPSRPWDFETTVTASLTGGRQGLRGASGSFMENEVINTFETGIYKKVDVNLSTQTLTLLEGGTPVFTCLVSSGKSGYSTPTGDYSIYAKDRVAAMSSAQNAVEFYYIADVPYVMWFNGNYSIHGAYWHNDFGNVRSHGCVNVSVASGEFIFDWAPVGTPVSVHY